MDSSSKSTVERSHRRLRCEYYMLAAPAIRLGEVTNNSANLTEIDLLEIFLLPAVKTFGVLT